MSKQQGTNFPELEERKRGKSKKRHGKFELWMRYNPPDKTKPIFTSVFQDWHCIRKYETLELAEENLANSKRKWPSEYWQLEIRVRNEK